MDPQNIDAWNKFRESGMLWAVNSFLHIFGYAIAYKMEGEKLLDVFPVRVSERGFPEEANKRGYANISKYMKENAGTLLKEASL